MARVRATPDRRSRQTPGRGPANAGPGPARSALPRASAAVSIRVRLDDRGASACRPPGNIVKSQGRRGGWRGISPSTLATFRDHAATPGGCRALTQDTPARPRAGLDRGTSDSAGDPRNSKIMNVCPRREGWRSIRRHVPSRAGQRRAVCCSPRGRRLPWHIVKRPGRRADPTAPHRCGDRQR